MFDTGDKLFSGVNLSPESLTPVNNLYFPGVNNTAEKLFTGVNDTTDKFFGGVSDTSD
jgi:hypothetical protein